MINETIIHFLQEQSYASICCIDEEGKPYCFSCFYAFESAPSLLYFKSSKHSTHAELLKKNPFIAGTVLPDKLNKLLVKGVQFEGIILDEDHPLTKRSVITYLKRHLLAMAIPGETRTIQINHIKMMDNAKGISKKITWDRNEIKENVV